MKKLNQLAFTSLCYQYQSICSLSRVHQRVVKAIKLTGQAVQKRAFAYQYRFPKKDY